MLCLHVTAGPLHMRAGSAARSHCTAGCYALRTLPVTAHLSGLHSAIQMLVGKLSAIQQQVDAVAAGADAADAAGARACGCCTALARSFARRSTCAFVRLLWRAAAGTVPFPHAMMRQVNSLVCSLPALDSAAFRKCVCRVQAARCALRT